MLTEPYTLKEVTSLAGVRRKLLNLKHKYGSGIMLECMLLMVENLEELNWGLKQVEEKLEKKP